MSNTLELLKLSVNGAELHYQEAGKGDLVVLVHGTVADYRTWRRQFSVFSKQYHVVSYSRRLHFPNVAQDDKEYSVELHTDDLSLLVQHFTEKPAHIVSASWGGNVALYLALTRPELVRTLVLGEPPALPLLIHDAHYKHLADEFNENAFFPARSALLNNKWEDGVRFFVDGVMGKGSFDAMPSGMRRYFLDNATELKAEALSTQYMFNFTRELIAKISSPVLLLEGDKSPKLFHAILNILESSLPHSERHLVPNASHAIHVDNATMYNKHVLDFLSRN